MRRLHRGRIAPCGRARPSTPSTRPAVCTTRCPSARAGSASTTIPPSRSRGCSRRAPSGSPTSTSTCTTATVRRRSSGTTRACSPSRCTSTSRRSSSPGRARCRSGVGRTRPAARSTSRCPRGTGDGAWLDALRTIVPRVVTEFAPDVLVTQLGCDTHHTDPLAQLRLTTRAYREAAATLHELAHEVAGGRWVATGGGGYRWAHVVPRAWTLEFAEMAGVADDLPDELPSAWVDRASRSRRRAGARDLLGTVARGASGRRRGPAGRRGGLRHTVGLMARTKLVCTLGPASATPKMVQGLVRAGASVFRLNFSHGAPEDHARMVELIREAEEATGKPLAALVDLPGPKVRLGPRAPRSVHVQAGAALRAAARGRGRCAGRLDHLPGARERPLGGRPDPARRRRGRAAGRRHRRRYRQDPVHRRRCRSKRSRGERAGRAPRSAGGHRTRPRGAGAGARSRRRSRGAVVRAGAVAICASSAPRWGTVPCRSWPRSRPGPP